MVANPANRQLIRALNRSTVLNVVREVGPISKAEVARSTGLSQATVGSIVRSLIDEGLVAESEPTATGVGRPPTLLQLDLDSYNVIGLKVMEEHLVGAVSDLEARTLGQTDIPLSSKEPSKVADKAAQVVEELLAQSGVALDRLLGIGIGMAGVIDTARGICVSSPFLGWHNVPIAELVHARVKVPIRVDNDVNTLALAERWFGAGQKVDDFLLVTLGRGVGLSVVAGGRVYRGSRGGAAEFGHTVIGESQALCSCGNRGCIEATLSAASLTRAAQEISRAHDLPVPQSLDQLLEMAGNRPDLSALLTAAGEEFGRALGNLINLFAPALVIISGEGVRAAEPMIAAAQAEVERHVHPGLRGSFDLMVESLDDEAWARGAASLVLGAVFDMPTRHTTAETSLWLGQPRR